MADHHQRAPLGSGHEIVDDRAGRRGVEVRDGLVEQSRIRGLHLRERLEGMRERFEEIGDLRGRGLLQGIELVTSKATKEPAEALGAAVTVECLRRGLHMNIVQLPGMGGVFRVAPPLTISQDELDLGVDILETSLETVLAGSR